MLFNNSFIIDYKKKANIFNDYFILQCTPFVTSSSLPPLVYKTDKRLEHFTITSNEVAELLVGIKKNKAHGPDEISANMIHLCRHHLAKPLQIIFQNIIDTGQFPDIWKCANVTPVHKKKDKQIVENYRPISLLPLFAKVFE